VPNILNDAATARAKKAFVPSLTEIADRFTNLEDKFQIYIRSMGYIPELRRNGKSMCVVDVQTCINILDKGVAIDVPDGANLRKLRNSIVYYNEYFCKGKENESGEYRPALKAYSYIEEKYRLTFKVKEIDWDKGNPYVADILNGVPLTNDKPTIEEQRKKYADVKVSIKTATQKPIEKKENKEKVIPMYIQISSQIVDPIDFNNWSDWFDNIECE
jgi:hypothetical protein